MNIFEPANMGTVRLKNRIIRSATFEGMGNEEGLPGFLYKKMYVNLARNGVGGIITGFNFVSEEGKAMQPGQTGLASALSIPYFREVVNGVHQYDCKIFAQLAHTGRQTRSSDTGKPVVGASEKKSMYFKSKPRKLTTEEVCGIINKFALAALHAKQAGFDGIQLHAAHGYLIHQFLLPCINNRKDIFAVDPTTEIGTKFLDIIIDKIREQCGWDYPILIKISGSDDYGKNSFSANQFIRLINFLNEKKVDGIEISYGTMDQALNIIRGQIPTDIILNHNPVYNTNKKLNRWLLKNIIFPTVKKRLKPFAPMYNLQYAKEAKKHTRIPIISVGGYRSSRDIKYVIKNGNADFVSMSRTFICEPDFVEKMKLNENYISKCVNCNYCTVMCDTNNPTKCRYLVNGTV